MSVNTRTSVLAAIEETTEGTPGAPAGVTSYMRMQDDFEMAPERELLENAELSASLALSKPKTGIESPSFSFSHYLRHSGTEGAPPDYAPFLKALFGSVFEPPAEYDTVASSTVGLVKVDTGEGANFRRGQAVLVKDPVNGYSIRPIHSISGDDLILGFNLAAAPASGVDLGDSVNYSPSEDAHPSLTVWNYLGNGGGVQMMAGAQVSEGSFSFEAGQFINGSYSLEGLGFYWNPIQITSSTRWLDFTDDDGTFAAAVPVKWYRDPHELAEALQTAMATANPGQTPTVTYVDKGSDAGKFRIRTTGTLLSLLWNTGANTANSIATKIGFTTAANSTGTAAATGYLGAQISLAAPHTPSYNDTEPLVAKNNLLMIGEGASEISCVGAMSVSINYSKTLSANMSICSETGKSGLRTTERNVSIEIAVDLTTHEAKQFERFRKGSEIRLAYVAGEKVGGNWVPGKNFCWYFPQAMIAEISASDADGKVALNMTIRTYPSATGLAEAYLSLV